jgi:dolichyl-phosphate-mannose-protein mannosyltransferase
MRKWLILTSLALGSLSFGLFLFRIGTPATFIIDECVYVPAARAFLMRTPDPAPRHPPLAKILIAGGMRLLGDRPAGWRLASAVFGSLTLVVIFLWTYVLLRDFAVAALAASLTLFNNFLYTMSRIAMLDAIYFAFVMLGVFAFTIIVLNPDLQLGKRRLLVVISGILFGLGAACKWNAIVELGAVELLAAYLFIRNRYNLRELGIPALFVGLCIAPAVAYFLAFQAPWPGSYGFWSIRDFFVENAFIWRWHKLAPGAPQFNVRWYQWFFKSTPERGMGYLMGNWVVMWVGIPAFLYCAWRVWRYRLDAMPEALLVSLYAVNVIQWLLIPQRVTCYYYYYPSAMLLGVAIAVALQKLPVHTIIGVRPGVLILVATTIFFLRCYGNMAAFEAPLDCVLGCW